MIDVCSIYKSFGETSVLAGVSFHVPKGQAIAVTGKSGCGKSTLANIIAGYIKPSGGSIAIGGADIDKHPVRAKSEIGFLSGGNPIYGSMTAGEFLRFIASLKRISGSDRRYAVADALAFSGAEPDRLISHQERGVVRRLGLAAALIGDPGVLLLDEPTLSLSAADAHSLRDTIKQLRRRKTILLFTSSLSEAIDICEQVIILNGGAVVLNDSLAGLMQRVSDKNRLKLRLAGSPAAAETLLRSIPGVLDIETQGSFEKGSVDIVLETPIDADIRRSVFEICAANGMPLIEMQYLNVSVEDIFLQFTGSRHGGF